VVDLRGHGASTAQPVSFGRLEVADLSSILDQLHEDRSVAVFGEGYGAYIALNWAARDTRIKAVVALDPYIDLQTAFYRMAEERNLKISDKQFREAIRILQDRTGTFFPDWSAVSALHQMKTPTLLAQRVNRPSITNDNEMLNEAAPPGSAVLNLSQISWDNAIELIQKWLDRLL
jgi:pimeloyl-ACP methyl ester carboxylesterase